MTKNIDQRLFGYRRYVYSQNLLLPKKNYINSDIEKDKEFYKKIIQDKELIYQNEYINPFDNSKVIYLEYSKKETLSNLPAIMDFIVAAREFQNTYSVNNQDVNNKLDINQLNDKLNINNKLED